MSLHGGNRREASEKYNIPEEEIIDLSSNINPLGLHPDIKKIINSNLNKLQYYPDPECKELQKVLSDYYHINKKNILSGNGSVEFIYLLPDVLKPKKVLIVQPDFLEYELSLKHLSCKIQHITGKEEDNFKVKVVSIVKEIPRTNILYLSNPNNPAGYIYSRNELCFLLDSCKKNNCYLFIDEVFLDFIYKIENLSMMSLISQNKYLIVLKSFTKFYAIPGIRHGLIAADEKIISKLKSRQIPWSVNNMAQTIVSNILKDQKYYHKTINYINKEKKFLISRLLKIKEIKLFPSTANFLLCKIISNHNAESLQDELAKDKIIIRNCSNYTGLNNKYFRIAVKTRKENLFFLKSLNYFFNKER